MEDVLTFELKIYDFGDVVKAPAKTGMERGVRLRLSSALSSDRRELSRSQVPYRVRTSDPLWPRAMRRRPVMAWRSVSRGAHRRSM